ncbi:MAG: membrane protein insertase YidC [Coxiellaceae bacterium]|nr:membrane protein insertase YidC [Coxiellaceae bacterium]
MESRRTILYFVLAILGVMVWHAWTLDHPASAVAATSAQVAASAHPSDFAPASYGGTNASPYQATAKNAVAVTAQSKFISVKTDVIDAQINLRGGTVANLKLLKYPVSLQDKNTPVQILNANHDNLYVAQSGLSTANEKTVAQPVMFNASQTTYALADGQNQLVVTLNGKTNNGIAVQKTLTFTRGSYAIATAMKLTNDSGTTWNGNIYNQITRRDIPATGAMASRSYNGASVSTPSTPYKKLTFADMSESDFSRDVQNGWVAMQQQYFLSTWVPEHNQTLHYYSRSFGNGEHGANNIFILGYLSQPIALAPNANTTFNATLYVGPEIAKNLLPLAKGLDLTVDYGWLWPISKFLFWLMSKIHHYIGNWGWSIIAVTILIKVAFYGLSNKSYASMAKTRDLQPKIKVLRDRHGDDKQSMSKAMMDLYRKEKINPLGGCLPMVVQIPVFIALYYVLIESVELRQAPFILWIHDLSVMDPYFILPVLMGLSMLLQQKLSPPPPDPMQAKMMMFLPLVFTIFFCTFPAGLVLYWLTNNCASVLQQWIVMKRHKKNK